MVQTGTDPYDFAILIILLLIPVIRVIWLAESPRFLMIRHFFICSSILSRSSLYGEDIPNNFPMNAAALSSENTILFSYSMHFFSSFCRMKSKSSFFDRNMPLMYSTLTKSSSEGFSSELKLFHLYFSVLPSPLFSQFCSM